MAKISIKVELIKNKNIEISNKYKGIIVDDVIKYTSEFTSTLIDIKNNILKRINKEYEITLNFNEKKGTFKLNQIEVPISISDIEIKNKKPNYYIKYAICLDNQNKDIYEYNIKYEVIK